MPASASRNISFIIKKGKSALIKLSSLLKAIIVVCTLGMLRYPLLIPGGDALGVVTQQVIVAIIGGITAICLLSSKAGSRIRQEAHWLYKYIIPYAVAIGISAVYSFGIKRYSVYGLVGGITPYLLIVFTIPLIYIFKYDGGYIKFLKVIAILEIVILICKTLGWYFYNFGGPRLFEKLVLEFGDWVRDGRQRVEPGQLFAVTLVYMVYQCFKNRPRIRDIIIIVFMMIFLAIVCRFRFQIAVAIATIFIMLFYMNIKRPSSLLMRVILISLVIGILMSGLISQLISSFSISGNYGGSTLARIKTIQYYFDIMFEEKDVFGLGLLDVHDPSAYQLMQLDRSRLYYLEDIGILGGVVRFGVLALIVYGYLFVLSLRTCYKCYKNKNTTHLPFLLGIAGYMMMSCLALNIFDRQRAYAVPFYLACISYIDCQVERERNEKTDRA